MCCAVRRPSTSCPEHSASKFTNQTDPSARASEYVRTFQLPASNSRRSTISNPAYSATFLQVAGKVVEVLTACSNSLRPATSLLFAEIARLEIANRTSTPPVTKIKVRVALLERLRLFASVISITTRLADMRCRAVWTEVAASFC